MRSGEVLRLLGTYKTLDMHCRPSELLGALDEYTAFCFDEACAYIISRLQDGDKLKEKVSVEPGVEKASKPSDI